MFALALTCAIVGGAIALVTFLVALMWDYYWLFIVTVIAIVWTVLFGMRAYDLYEGANERCLARGGTWKSEGSLYILPENTPLYITIHDEGLCIGDRNPLPVPEG